MWVAEYRGGGFGPYSGFCSASVLIFVWDPRSVLVLVWTPKCLELSVWVTIIMVLVQGRIVDG